MKQRRALILYATMTKNTEKVANWFKETFEYYNWEVQMIRLKGKMDWTEYEGKTFFDDYDVICLGSPIVAGLPLQPVIDALSLNGDGSLLNDIKKELKGEQVQKDKITPAGSRWRRNPAPYPGIYDKRNSRPFGIVFSTYGGGFYGAGECQGVLSTLKVFLQNYDVDIVGEFACGGKETGPAGLPVGVKPRAYFIPGPAGKDAPEAEVCDAVTYTTKDGKKWPGSYFFHYNNEEKPGPKEEARARAFISDVVEDYFMTYDGERFIGLSRVISIS